MYTIIIRARRKHRPYTMQTAQPKVTIVGVWARENSQAQLKDFYKYILNNQKTFAILSINSINRKHVRNRTCGRVFLGSFYPWFWQLLDKKHSYSVDRSSGLSVLFTSWLPLSNFWKEWHCSKLSLQQLIKILVGILLFMILHITWMANN